MAPKLAYLVTEDWYFLSHRLPMARAAREAGFEVHVVTRVGTDRAAIEAEGFQVHKLDWGRSDTDPLRLIGPIRAVRKLLRELQPELLHTIALKPALVGALAAAGLGRLAVVNSVNGLGSGYLGGGAVGLLKRRALARGLGLLLNRPQTLTIVQNPEDMAAVRSFGVASEKLRLVPGSGVDTGRFRPSPEPPGGITVAYAGRMLADKGLRTLMAAHRLLRARGVPVRLLLAGAPDPDNATSIPADEIAGWAREPGVTVLGHVGDIATVWAQSHIAVLASRREGLPLSLLEASACGRPMIASDVPGCREVVIPEETGLLVPADDPVRLADAIAQLAQDKDRRLRMGEAARRRAESQFSAQIVSRKIAAVYRELADVAAS